MGYQAGQNELGSNILYIANNASSRSLKENIRPLSTKDAFKALDALEPMRYNDKINKGDEYVGFIAEDVPELVASENRKSLASMDIVAVLTKVVKAQRQEMVARDRRIAQLKAKNIALKIRMDSLDSNVDMLVRAMAANQMAQLQTTGNQGSQ